MPVVKDVTTGFTISGEKPPQGEMSLFLGLVGYGNHLELAAHLLVQ
jgi:hypothetical protein